MVYPIHAVLPNSPYSFLYIIHKGYTLVSGMDKLSEFCQSKSGPNEEGSSGILTSHMTIGGTDIRPRRSTPTFFTHLIWTHV